MHLGAISNSLYYILHTFQKFDGHCVWWFSIQCLSCYVYLGWSHGNIHRECAFVDLTIVPFSQFGSNTELGSCHFPMIALGR